MKPNLKFIYNLLLLVATCVLSACAVNPAIPVGTAKSFYKQEGIIETYYEQVTASNSNEMLSFLNDNTKISKWRHWDEWRPKINFAPEDELWYFNSDPKSWKNNAGRMGFCVFRDGEIIATYITLMN